MRAIKSTRRSRVSLGIQAVTLIAATGAVAGLTGDPPQNAAPQNAAASDRAEPAPSATLGARPMDDDVTIVLFDGRQWTGWQTPAGEESAWIVHEDGSVQVNGADAVTSQQWDDFQLHLEFLCPPSDNRGQARSNSGVYLHGRYEVQVLDSFGDEPAMNGCGAIYSIAPPLCSASRPAGEWQTYDIIFRAPRISESGEVAEAARVTVLHNGIVIHNNLELPHATPGGLDTNVGGSGPLLLQDHGDPVRYRNIWLRKLK